MVLLAKLEPELSEAAGDPETAWYEGIFITSVTWLGAVCEKLSESLGKYISLHYLKKKYKKGSEV